MFLCVSDPNEYKKYININRIKEFELKKVKQEDLHPLQIVFHTNDLKVFHITFEKDQEPVLKDLIHELCNYGRSMSVTGSIR